MKVSGAIGEKVKHVAVKGRALVALPTENVQKRTLIIAL